MVLGGSHSVHFPEEKAEAQEWFNILFKCIVVVTRIGKFESRNLESKGLLGHKSALLVKAETGEGIELFFLFSSSFFFSCPFLVQSSYDKVISRSIQYVCSCGTFLALSVSSPIIP